MYRMNRIDIMFFVVDGFYDTDGCAWCQGSLLVFQKARADMDAEDGGVDGCSNLFIY